MCVCLIALTRARMCVCVCRIVWRCSLPGMVVCVLVVDYAAERASAVRSLAAAVPVVRAYVLKLQKAQRAAEIALDMYAF